MLYELQDKVIGQPDVSRKRRFGNSNASKSIVQIQDGTSIENLESFFQPMLLYLDVKGKMKSGTVPELMDENELERKKENVDDYERYFEVGTGVKIKWTFDEIGDSGWKPGCRGGSSRKV